MTGRTATYDVSNIFRKSETQNGEHALERIFVLIDAVTYALLSIVAKRHGNEGRSEKTKTYEAKRSGRSR
jgi:hypothetical protein